MNVSLRVRLASLILLIGSTSACVNPFLNFQRPENEHRNSLEEAKRILEKEKREDEKMARKLAPRTFDLTTETGKVLNDAFEALSNENFEWLDQQARQARKEKARLAGGYWKIRNIYIGLESPTNGTDEEWQKHFERLNRWKENFPDSITARVAIAESWIEYAWQARGTGYAHTISEEELRHYHERLNVAEQELLEAKNLAERCPQWHAALLAVAHSQGWEFEDFDAAYQEAAKFEPSYYYFAVLKGSYLLPRWYGEKGDWEAFVENASAEIGGAEGAIIYYLVASDYISDYKDPAYDSSKLSMEKAKQGFYALKKNYGADKQRLNEFAKFAIRINDLPAAHEAFEEIGDDWLEGVWSSKQKFDQYKSIAAAARKTADRHMQRQ